MTLSDASISLPWRVWHAVARRSGSHLHILSAFTVVATAAIGAKAIAFGRDFAIAYHFGAGDLVDAFLIAYLVPYTLLTVLGGALHSAFLPVFVRVRGSEGEEAASRLLGGTTALVLVAVTVLTLALALLADPLLAVLASGFAPEKLALTRSLLFLLLPVCALGTLVTLWTAPLNAARQFALPAASPALPPLALMAAVLAFGKEGGITAAALGLLVGHAAEALLVGGALRRRGTSLAPRWSGVTAGVREVIGQLLPLLAATALMSMTTFVDQGMAAALGSGSVAALGYGAKLSALLAGVLALALGTAVFPHFSELVAAGRHAELRSHLRLYSRLILWASLIPVAALVLQSDRIVVLLFERGAFTPEHSATVGSVQALYLLQIPFYLTGILGVRMLTAVGRGRVVMSIAAVNVLAKVVGNLVFMRWLGVAGIALSTSFVYALSCVLIFAALNRYLHEDTWIT